MFDIEKLNIPLEIRERYSLYHIHDLWFLFPKKVYREEHVVNNATYNIGDEGVWRVRCLNSFKRGKNLIISSEQGINLVFFNASSKIEHMFPYGATRIVYGKIAAFRGAVSISNPYIVNQYLPIFKGGYNFRTCIKKALEHLPNPLEWLPENLIIDEALPTWHQAIMDIHTGTNDRHTALTRIAYDYFIVGIYMMRMQFVKRTAYPVFMGKLCYIATQALPFTLTESQQQAFDAILADIALREPMNRVLYGEVGSGKTIIAILTALAVVDSGHQVVVMLPTDVLANQMHREFKKYFANTYLLTSKLSEKTKRGVIQGVSSGDVSIVVGTHSVLNEKVEFLRLGLIIIDEDHKFGVSQRESIYNKGNAHILFMTATPIPRSIQFMKFALYSVSSLERRESAGTIDTIVISESRLDEVVDKIAQRANDGKHIYWVCHDISHSLRSKEEILKKRIANVHILHSGIQDKEYVLNQFQKQGGVLLSTTVIETGVNITSADVIVVDNACMFGVSQLHQLRGRVGRGENKGYCVLIRPNNCSSVCMKRLYAMKKHSTGNTLAEVDFINRGPGSFLGTEQSGFRDFPFMKYIFEKHIPTINEYVIDILPKYDHPIKRAFEFYSKYLGSFAEQF